MLAYQPIRSLATLNMVAYQGSAAANRIFIVIDKPIKIKNEAHLPSLLTKGCSIEFKNVGFKYDTTNERAVNNIDIKIEGWKSHRFSWSKWCRKKYTNKFNTKIL